MWRRVYRQRRRLLLGILLYMGVGLMMTPFRDAGGLMVALVVLPLSVTVVFAVLIALRPRWGMVVETLGITILLWEMLFNAAPLLEVRLAETGIALPMLLWFFTYYGIVNFGQSLNRFDWPGRVRFRAERVIARPPDALWRALALEPGTEHWDPAVVAVRAGGDGWLELVPAEADVALPPGTAERVLEETPGQRLSLRRMPRPDRPDRPVTVEERIAVAPLGARAAGGGSEVTLERRWGPVPLLTAARLWLEDQAGDTLDDLAAIVEGRPNWSLSALRRRRGIAAGSV